MRGHDAERNRARMFKSRREPDGGLGTMEISQHLAALEEDGALLADAAEAAGLAARVPACPGWRVRDLVRHQAYVHRWAGRHVAEQPVKIIHEASEDDILSHGPPDEQLLASYREGVTALARILREAGPGVRCATFLPAPSPLAFWARRQAHETAIHRFDAQQAGRSGAPDPKIAFGPAFAADGIDEVIAGFAARVSGDGTARDLLVRATDTAGAWRFSLPAEGRARIRRCRPDEATGTVDCELSGVASGLYLVLWNRCAPEEASLTATGDLRVLHAWNGGVRVGWD